MWTVRSDFSKTLSNNRKPTEAKFTLMKISPMFYRLYLALVLVRDIHIRISIFGYKQIFEIYYSGSHRITVIDKSVKNNLSFYK